jgi:protein O-GlcNAc transferase
LTIAFLVLTFIDRKGTRRLEKQDELISALRTSYLDITINVADFASINRREQICIVANTDILAAITHFMWLPSGSAVVEFTKWVSCTKDFETSLR